MTRYDQIEAVEDLGLHYPPQDDTDDLVGANENAPADGQVDEGNKSIHSKGKTHV